jgi:hypothetical protein
MKFTRLRFRSCLAASPSLMASGLVLTFGLAARALDWPQRRGPQRNGISAETGWPAAWPKEGLKTLWKAEVGTGYSFDESTLRCLDFSTGEVKWEEKKYGKGSLMGADGRLIVSSERGQLGLAEAVPDGYKELAFVEALEVRANSPGSAAKQTWAAPVLANGRIYYRS